MGIYVKYYLTHMVTNLNCPLGKGWYGAWQKPTKPLCGGNEMKIRDIMTENPITVDRETSILEAMGIMKENKIRRLPVVDQGKLVGIVTEMMILEAFASPVTSLSIHQLRYLIEKVKDIMAKNPITIPPDANYKDVLLLCQERGIGAFPVVHKGKLVGITTESDLVRFVRCI
jgi:acetoin utilization protein AcuB